MRRADGSETIDVVEVAFHRNGSGTGEGFHVVLFVWDGRNLVASVFARKGCVAILDRDLLEEGRIEFGVNSWRAESFEPSLSEAVAEFEEGRAAV